jgi:hypothetical protein
MRDSFTADVREGIRQRREYLLENNRSGNRSFEEFIAKPTILHMQKVLYGNFTDDPDEQYIENIVLDLNGLSITKNGKFFYPHELNCTEHLNINCYQIQANKISGVFNGEALTSGFSVNQNYLKLINEYKLLHRKSESSAEFSVYRLRMVNDWRDDVTDVVQLSYGDGLELSRSGEKVVRLMAEIPGENGAEPEEVPTLQLKKWQFEAVLDINALRFNRNESGYANLASRFDWSGLEFGENLTSRHGVALKRDGTGLVFSYFQSINDVRKTSITRTGISLSGIDNSTASWKNIIDGTVANRERAGLPGGSALREGSLILAEFDPRVHELEANEVVFDIAYAEGKYVYSPGAQAVLGGQWVCLGKISIANFQGAAMFMRIY